MKITKTECKTYEVRIFCGLRKSYSQIMHNMIIAKRICQKYCDSEGFGLTFTQTEYIYTSGGEPGFIVGIINYPRFPRSKKEIDAHAVKIGEILLKELDQERLSIVFPKKTIMLENTGK